MRERAGAENRFGAFIYLFPPRNRSPVETCRHTLGMGSEAPERSDERKIILQHCTQNQQRQAAQSAQDAQTPQTQYVCADADGKLPSCAPLANPYVPFQQTGSEQYQADYGLIRGTIFPGLDLPYRGMVNTEPKTGTQLAQIQALGFAINELGLYLDTHRDDEEATALYNQYAERYEDALQQYQQSGGNLTQMLSAQSGSYRWPDDPWPWDYRKEG